MDGTEGLIVDVNVKDGVLAEPTVSTILLNFANEFDPYDALKCAFLPNIHF